MSEFVWTNKTYISEILTVIPSCSGILRVFQSPCSTAWRLIKSSLRMHLPTHTPCTNCKKGTLHSLRKAAEIFLHHPGPAGCQDWSSLSQLGRAAWSLAAWAGTACRWQQCPTSYSTVSCGILSPTANRQRDTWKGLHQRSICLFPIGNQSCPEQLKSFSPDLLFQWHYSASCNITFTCFTLIHHSEHLAFYRSGILWDRHLFNSCAYTPIAQQHSCTESCHFRSMKMNWLLFLHYFACPI